MLMEQIESYQQCHVYNDFLVDVCFKIEKRCNECTAGH